MIRVPRSISGSPTAPDPPAAAPLLQQSNAAEDPANGGVQPCYDEHDGGHDRVTMAAVTAPGQTVSKPSSKAVSYPASKMTNEAASRPAEAVPGSALVDAVLNDQLRTRVIDSPIDSVSAGENDTLNARANAHSETIPPGGHRDFSCGGDRAGGRDGEHDHGCDDDCNDVRAISRAAMTMVVTACGRPGGRLCGQPGGLMTVIFCPDFSRDLWCDVSKEFGGPCGEAKHLIETAKAERRLPKRKGEEVGARVRQR